MKPPPDCIWLTATVHVISDKANTSATLEFTRPQWGEEFDWSPLVEHSCVFLNNNAGCDDARPMTGAEVMAFQTQQANNELAEGEFEIKKETLQ